MFFTKNVYCFKKTNMFGAVKTVLLEGLLLCVCVVGDYLLKNPVSRTRAVIAVTDNITHGLIGLVSWSIVCNVKTNPQDLLQCILCLLLAMMVDIDHFIAARSLSIEAAVSLPSRPPFHATTLIFLIDLTLLLFSYVVHYKEFQLLTMIFTVAWLSHHIRDAVRRGLWFYPLGETPPLSNEVYLGLVASLPLVMKIFYDLWSRSRARTVTPDDIV